MYEGSFFFSSAQIFVGIHKFFPMKDLVRKKIEFLFRSEEKARTIEKNRQLNFVEIPENQSIFQVRDISELIKNTNPGFQFDGDVDNDFIILKLSSPLELNEDVWPACLPETSTFLLGDATESNCFTSGWGITSTQSEISLQNFQYQKTCQKKWV